MAPNFLSKFVKNSPSSNAASHNSQRSRSPSPSRSNQHPPTVTVDPSSPTGPRPRRHTTSGSVSPTFDGSTESFPDVTVVPPSPRSQSHATTDDDITPKSSQSPTTFLSNASMRKVPSMSDLSTHSSSRLGSENENLATPTPGTSRSTFSEQITDKSKSLYSAASVGNIREKASTPDPSARNSNHPRAATMAYQPTGDGRSRSSSRKSNKSGKGGKSKMSGSPGRKQSQTRHDRSASVPSLFIKPPTVTVSEDGVLFSSPTSEPSPLISAGSSNYSAHTYPNINSKLLSPDNSDALSAYSISSNATSRKKRGWSRKSTNGDNSVQPRASPAVSTTSLSPKKKTTGGLAQAIAASGLAMANPVIPVPPELPTTPGTSSSLSSRRQRRSSEYSRNGRSRQPSLVYPMSDFSDHDSYHSGQDGPDDQSGLEDDDDLDLDPDDIPVTGFAVASAKRNADFHELFSTVPEGDYLIDDYGCALQREILIQGRLYVSENHICFHANIFGWITDLVISMSEVTSLEKRMTAFVIPNAIQVTTTTAKYTFTSFLSRDNTYEVLKNVWRLARPEGSSAGSQMHSPRGSIEMPISDAGSAITGLPSASSIGDIKSPVKSKATQCACGINGEHLSEIAMESILPGTPEQIYNLMFTSGFIKDFMVHEQNLSDLQISDWMPTADNPKLLYRQMSYIKPLGGGIGPKQTKCELRDETLHCDFDDYVCMLTTTRTPDVPSGSVFSVKTRTCITWASSLSTKIIVTTQVDWTGRSFIKGLIERSAIDGQKQYHADLDKSMRAYIHEHQTEFIPEGVDVSAVETEAAHVVDASPRPSMERASLSTQELRKTRDYERGQRGLQWAYDTFDGAYKVAKQSIEGLFELIRDGWDQSSSTTILYFVICFLVISNIWTLSMVGRREEIGRRKEVKKTQEREKWVQGVVTALWEELIASRTSSGIGTWTPSPRAAGDWKEEVGELSSVLDNIEERVKHIRESLAELD